MKMVCSWSCGNACGIFRADTTVRISGCSSLFAMSGGH